jgi:hypothetical protein
LDVSRILTKNFKLVELLPETDILSPVSRTNFPGRRFTVSPAGIGKFLTNSVSIVPLL